MVRLSQLRGKSKYAFNTSAKQEWVTCQNKCAFDANVLQFTCFPWVAKCPEQNRKAHVEAESCPSIRGVRSEGFTANKWLHKVAICFAKLGAPALYPVRLTTARVFLPI